jgi:cytochrome c oxidase subunit 2
MLMAPAAEAAQKAAEAAPEAAPAAAEAAAEAVTKLPPLETAHSWAMPTQASTFAESTDGLYFFIVALDVFFFVILMAAMAWFMWKYRRRSKDQKTSSITHNGKVEFLWSAIPAVLLVIIFVWGEIDFVKQSLPPTDAVDVRVTGRKWYWTVEYPNYPGVSLTSNVEEPQLTLLVPKDRPVRLTMTSEDVIHSFFIPAFRVKRDAVPGRYTSIWFEATRVGEFNVFCTEYCGDLHSAMTGVVRVVEPDQFENILTEMGKLEQEEGETPEQFGQRIYSRRGCNACHSLDGTPGTGPSWKGMCGRQESFTDGSSLAIDCDGAEGKNYIKQSVLDPNAKIVQGFAGGMPSFQGQLEDKHIDALIAFMKTLK